MSNFDDVTALSDSDLEKEIFFAVNAATRDDNLTMGWLQHLRAERVRRRGHPAACPHCGSTHANQVQPDYLLRDVRFENDGSITIGEVDHGVDFPGPMLMYCHACGSEYIQPDGIEENFDHRLRVTCTIADDATGDSPGWIGKTITWLAVTDDQIQSLSDAFDDAREYREPQNAGCCPDDALCEDHANDRAKVEAYDTLLQALQAQRRGSKR